MKNSNEEMYDVLKALKEGRQLQVYMYDTWYDVQGKIIEPLEFDKYKYRVKPDEEPMINVPYKMKDFISALSDNGMCIKQVAEDKIYIPVEILDNGVIIAKDTTFNGLVPISVSYDTLMHDYIWAKTDKPCCIRYNSWEIGTANITDNNISEDTVDAEIPDDMIDDALDAINVIKDYIKRHNYGK